MSEKFGVHAKVQESKEKSSNFSNQSPGYKSSGSPADRILQLQRTAGNQAVQRLIKSRALQAKLRVGQPNDIYEQEADRVAEQVMMMPEPQAASSGTLSIQRTCQKCEKEILRRQPIEEEELLQTKEISGQNAETKLDLESRINAIRGGGHPLAEYERSFFEPRFGYDFSQVRVHTDSRAAELAREVNARAFTVDQHVVFGAGQYALEKAVGQRLFAHELTHVVQQRGNVSPWVRGSSPIQLQLQTDDEAKRIRFRCGPGGMGCDLTMTCDGKPCALSDCGKGRCPTCPGDLGGMAVRNWCKYRCVPSGSAFYLVSAIGGWKFFKICIY